MEHLVLASKRQFICVASDGFRIVDLSDAGLARNGPIFEHGEGIKHELVAMSSLFPVLSACVIRRAAGDPVLLALKVVVEDLRAIQWQLDRSCEGTRA